MATSSNIRLVIADVDGTLVTQDKELTPRTIEAVRRLRAAGIAFSLTTGRPPLGAKMLVEPLALTGLIAAFNGGVIVRPDLSVVSQSFLPPEIASRAVETILNSGLDAWLYTDRDWFVRDPAAPHVEHEQWTVKFAPKVVPDFSGHFDCVAKIVGVSDDFSLVAAAESGVRRACGPGVSASRSQPYYLDVTHPDANKGHVVDFLSQSLSVPSAQIATIGDGPNDVMMFARSGLSIAMGNATPEVQRAARFVTSSNQDDGFAHAIHRFILHPDEAGSRMPSGAIPG